MLYICFVLVEVVFWLCAMLSCMIAACCRVLRWYDIAALRGSCATVPATCRQIACATIHNNPRNLLSL